MEETTQGCASCADATLPEQGRSIRLRLLDLLLERGPMDSRLAAQVTGIAKPTVTAILHAALGRGMVEVVPRSQLPAAHPCLGDGPLNRGAVYRFVCYEARLPNKRAEKQFLRSSFPTDLANLLDNVFRPTLRASVSVLDNVAQRRVVQLPM
jgi:hypothetical protein